MAASWLASKSPAKTRQQWLRWLCNNRAPNRSKRFCVPCQGVMGRTIYQTQDLQHLVTAMNAMHGLGHVSQDSAAWLVAHTSE